MSRNLAIFLAMTCVVQTVSSSTVDVCNQFNSEVGTDSNKVCRSVLNDLGANNLYETCVFFRDCKPNGLLPFLEGVNNICHDDQTDEIICRDIVFMIHSGNVVGQINFDKLKDFVQDIVTDLATSTPSITLFIKYMAFSSEVTVSTTLENLIFSGETTNTHLAIARLDELFNISSGNDCLQVGVVLLHGLTTNWRATLDELVTINQHHKEARLIAVGVDNPMFDRKIFESQLKAIATGFLCDNMKLVNSFNTLPHESLFSMIVAPQSPIGDECTQYAAVDSMDTIEGYLGVYEQDSNGKTCGLPPNTFPIYRHTESESWHMSLVPYPWTTNPDLYLWVISSDDVEDCVWNLQLAIAMNLESVSTLTQHLRPDQMNNCYTEFRISFICQMLMKCFSHQKLPDYPVTCD